MLSTHALHPMRVEPITSLAGEYSDAVLQRLLKFSQGWRVAKGRIGKGESQFWMRTLYPEQLGYLKM